MDGEPSSIMLLPLLGKGSASSTSFEVKDSDSSTPLKESPPVFLKFTRKERLALTEAAAETGSSAPFKADYAFSREKLHEELEDKLDELNRLEIKSVEEKTAEKFKFYEHTEDKDLKPREKIYKGVVLPGDDKDKACIKIYRTAILRCLEKHKLRKPKLDLHYESPALSLEFTEKERLAFEAYKIKLRLTLGADTKASFDFKKLQEKLVDLHKLEKEIKDKKSKDIKDEEKEIRIKAEKTTTLRALMYFTLDADAEAIFDIEDLQEKLTLLNKFEKETKDIEEKILINTYKLAILSTFEKHLLQLSEKHVPDKADHEKEETFGRYFLRRLGYAFLLFAGMFIYGVGSFAGCEQIFELLNFISPATGVAISSAFTIINSVLFYAFEADQLKQSMDIESLSQLGLLLKQYDQEMQLTEKINGLMKTQAHKFSEKNYHQYADLAEVINQNIRDKQLLLGKKETESTFTKALRYFITFVGALMAAADAYFITYSVLEAFAASLIGTSLGWAFIGTGIVTMLAYYIAMQGKAMINMVNPTFEKANELKARLDQFKPLHGSDFKTLFEEMSFKLPYVRSELKSKYEIRPRSDADDKIADAYKTKPPTPDDKSAEAEIASHYSKFTSYYSKPGRLNPLLLWKESMYFPEKALSRAKVDVPVVIPDFTL